MTPIKFYMERDMYWGSFDIDFILLGLGFSVSWEWKSDKTKTPQWRFDKRIAALIKESNAKVAKNKKSKKKK